MCILAGCCRSFCIAPNTTRETASETKNICADENHCLKPDDGGREPLDMGILLMMTHCDSFHFNSMTGKTTN